MVELSKLKFCLQLPHQTQHLLLIEGCGHDLYSHRKPRTIFQCLSGIPCVEVIVLVIKVKFISTAQCHRNHSGRIVHHIPRSTVREKVLQVLNIG